MKSNYKIVYFLSQFPKMSESFVLNEIHELEKRGHSVSVFSLKRPNNAIEHPEYHSLDITIEYIPSPSAISGGEILTGGLPSPSLFYDSLQGGGIKQAIGNVYIQNHFRKFLKEEQPDIVHSHFVNWPRLAAQSAAETLDIPFTVTAHAYGLFKNNGGSPKRVLKSADRILTISEYNRQYIQENYVQRQDIDIVRMGIRPQKFTPSGSIESGRILSVGRFVEKKGLKYAIEAFSQLPADGVELRLASDGPRKGELQKQTKELGLEDRVTFLGRIPDDELIEEYDKADIFLLPCVLADDGDRDGIPVTLMEAMAMRTIPVSTTISGIPELISHGENGYLARPRDTGSLATMLNKALSLNDQSTVRDTAQTTITNSFTIVQTVDSLTDSFDRINDS